MSLLMMAVFFDYCWEKALTTNTFTLFVADLKRSLRALRVTLPSHPHRRVRFINLSIEQILIYQYETINSRKYILSSRSDNSVLCDQRIPAIDSPELRGIQPRPRQFGDNRKIAFQHQ